jgi:protein-S-isoprenylcysteine O-methyltransferase Ste14
MQTMLTGIAILACWLFLVVYWSISAPSAKPTAEGQDWSGRLARMPIWLGYILFMVIWAYPFGMVAIRRTAASGSLGAAICALGLLVSIWSRRALGSEWSQDVELKQGHKLVERGPYAFVRHPIYTGHLLMALGTAMGSGRLVAFAALPLFLVGFCIKLRQEERLLVRSFPEEYPAYRARVRALVPYLW